MSIHTVAAFEKRTWNELPVSPGITSEVLYSYERALWLSPCEIRLKSFEPVRYPSSPKWIILCIW